MIAISPALIKKELRQRADARRRPLMKTASGGKTKRPGKKCGGSYISASFKCSKHFTNGKLNAEGKAAIKEHIQKSRSLRGLPERRKSLRSSKQAVGSTKRTTTTVKTLKKTSPKKTTPTKKTAVKAAVPGAVSAGKVKQKKLPKIKTQKDFEKYARGHIADLSRQNNGEGLLYINQLRSRMKEHGMKDRDFDKSLVTMFQEGDDIRLSASSKLSNYGHRHSINNAAVQKEAKALHDKALDLGYGRKADTIQFTESDFKELPAIEAWHKSRKGMSSGEVITSSGGFDKAVNSYIAANSAKNKNLTPIHKVRDYIGDRITAKEFNTWLMDSQSKDKVQLMGGDLPGVSEEQLAKSLRIPGGGTRFYVKKL